MRVTALQSAVAETIPPPRTPYLRTAAPVLAVGVLLGLRRAELPLGDSDVLWASRAGLDMISAGQLPHHATYSWTAAGRPWTPNSWGWDILLGAMYRLGGLDAICVLGLLVIVIVAALVGAMATRMGASQGWTAAALAIVGLFELQDLRPRPQLVDYAMIFAFILLLPHFMQARRWSLVRSASSILALQVLWMNLHSSAVLGPVILGLGGLGLLARTRTDGITLWRLLGRLIALVVATAAGCFATPYGTALLTNITEVRRSSVGLIEEWEPSGIHGTGPIVGLIAIAIAALCGWFAFRARRFDYVAYLLVLAVATGSAVRFTPILLLLCVPQLALLADRLPVRRIFLTRVVGAGCVVLAAFAVTGAAQFAKLDDGVASPRLRSLLPDGCRMVNDYTIGGTLMLYRPDVRISVDGRNDMYGRALLLSVEGMLSGATGTLARLDADHVNCVLTYSSDRLVHMLKTAPDWQVIGTDAERTLLVRVSS